MKKPDLSKNTIPTYLLSFIFPAIIFSIALYLNNIYPGSNNTVLTYDGRFAVLPLYGHLSHLGSGFNNLVYSISQGLGGNFLGTSAYILSPLDIIYAFIPINLLPDALYFMMLFRTGMMGLFFSIFLKKNERINLSGLWSIVFSCCYALTSYNLLYSSWPVYFDTIMILPLIALGIENIVIGKKSKLFVFAMAFCLISCYYVAYMAVIAMSLYFFIRLLEENNSLKRIIKIILSYSAHALFSLGISLFIILPTVLDFERGKLSTSDSVAAASLIKFNFIEVFSQLLPLKYSNLWLNQPPKIYCSSITVILFILLLIITKNTKIRLGAIAILIIYYLSFSITPLDRIWHGFKDPTGYVCRYAFTFCFFMVYFAARGYSSLDLSRFDAKKTLISSVNISLAVYTILELTINSSYQLSKIATDYKFSNRKEYNRLCDIISDDLNIIQYDANSEFYRIAKNFYYSCSDNMLFGYNGFECFSSSFNLSAVEFCKKTGIISVYNYIDSNGVTPPIANVLDVEYYISYQKDLSDYYELIKDNKSFDVYQNQNALPLAYIVSNFNNSELSAFSDDPFENINIVYRDLFSRYSNETIQIFHPVDHVKTYSDTSENLIDINFVTDEAGNYWFIENNIDNPQNYSNYFVKYYLNGEQIGDFDTQVLRFCSDIGNLEAGKDYTLAIECDTPEIRDVYLYYLDTEQMNSICSKVNCFDVLENNSNGLHLSGHADSESTLLITLPFEKGYRIYNNGKLIDYDSYRNTFITIPVSEGSNDIIIKYLSPGLIPGIILSIISLILSVIYLSNKKKKELF